MKKTLTIVAIIFSITVNVYAQKNDPTSDSYRMKSFIDALMKKMTVDEKIGQLNLHGSGDIVTGQASNSDIGKKIKEGLVGGLFNIKTVEKINS